MGETIIKILVTIALAGILIGLLPKSPFTVIIQSIEQIPYLAELNWFFPVNRCIAALMAWASAIGIYYAVGWILRQLDIIGQ